MGPIANQTPRLLTLPFLFEFDPCGSSDMVSQIPADADKAASADKGHTLEVGCLDA